MFRGALRGRLQAGCVSLLLAGGLLAGCAAPPPLVELQGETMGTTWQVRLLLPEDCTADTVRIGIEAELAAIVASMSAWEPASDLSRYNAAPAGSWHALPAPLATVLRRGQELAAESAGAFDPTVGALVALWGFGPHAPGPQVPQPDAIADARARSGWQTLQWDGPRLLQPGGLVLDVSGIAKGYAVDAVAAWLDARGAGAWLVEIGGELRARGRRPDGGPWQVALEHPGSVDGEGTGSVPTLALQDRALATSGDYRHYFRERGEIRSHLIDPRTGAPARSGVASASVLAASAMDADALATALAVLEPEAGLALATRLGAEARVLVREGTGFREHLTPGFAKVLQR